MFKHFSTLNLFCIALVVVESSDTEGPTAKLYQLYTTRPLYQTDNYQEAPFHIQRKRYGYKKYGFNFNGRRWITRYPLYNGPNDITTEGYRWNNRYPWYRRGNYETTEGYRVHATRQSTRRPHFYRYKNRWNNRYPWNNRRNDVATEGYRFHATRHSTRRPYLYPYKNRWNNRYPWYRRGNYGTTEGYRFPATRQSTRRPYLYRYQNRWNNRYPWYNRRNDVTTERYRYPATRHWYRHRSSQRPYHQYRQKLYQYETYNRNPYNIYNNFPISTAQPWLQSNSKHIFQKKSIVGTTDNKEKTNRIFSFYIFKPQLFVYQIVLITLSIICVSLFICLLISLFRNKKMAEINHNLKKGNSTIQGHINSGVELDDIPPNYYLVNPNATIVQDV